MLSGRVDCRRSDNPFGHADQDSDIRQELCRPGKLDSVANRARMHSRRSGPGGPQIDNLRATGASGWIPDEYVLCRPGEAFCMHRSAIAVAKQSTTALGPEEEDRALRKRDGWAAGRPECASVYPLAERDLDSQPPRGAGGLRRPGAMGLNFTLRPPCWGAALHPEVISACCCSSHPRLAQGSAAPRRRDFDTTAEDVQGAGMEPAAVRASEPDGMVNPAPIRPARLKPFLKAVLPRIVVDAAKFALRYAGAMIPPQRGPKGPS